MDNFMTTDIGVILVTAAKIRNLDIGIGRIKTGISEVSR